jgi:hypothetical protein
MLVLGQQSSIDNRSSIDRWLNRSRIVSTIKHDELLVRTQNAYRSHGLCAGSMVNRQQHNNECSQGFAVSHQGDDVGHLIIVYDELKQKFDYTILFTNDYEHFFQKQGELKCMIYGTGRKSSRCRHLSLNFIDPNDIHPRHNMTWWRDPSTLYEHLKELIEMMDYEQHLHNRTVANQYNFYRNYFLDSYVLSESIQDKYRWNHSIRIDKNHCQNQSSTNRYTEHLSTWISLQTKNISLNYTFFQHLRKPVKSSMEPICLPPKVQQRNSTRNILLIDYMLNRIQRNFTLYRSETILRPILLNLIFDKNPANYVHREGNVTCDGFLLDRKT